MFDIVGLTDFACSKGNVFYMLFLSLSKSKSLLKNWKVGEGLERAGP